ncbi:MAG: dipeptidase [Minwuiales bacterium]|nr:dipeptidase [Minwuiales bacterium]
MTRTDTTAAATLHSDAIVCDLTLPWSEYGRPDLRERTLPRFAENGVDFVSLTLATDSESQTEVLSAIARERRYLLARPDRFRLIESVDDIRASKKDGTLAVSFNLQGTNAFAGNLDTVEAFYKLGVRHALMAYNYKNMVGDGCHERTDCGLSRYGIELVGEMNRVGMIVDCSHTGYRTTMEVMEVSTKPVIFSHSNPRSLWEHDRNIRDDQAKACAKTGGMIGVVGLGIFMGNDDASIDMLLRQIDHYADLVGPAHIGLGLDFVYDLEAMQEIMARLAPASGNYGKMASLFQPEELPALTEAMLAKGYSDRAVRGILGENFLRVAEAVWR